MPLASEVAGNLLPLLDKNQDADELIALRKRIDDFLKQPRAVTPIAIPLQENLTRVTFSDGHSRPTYDLVLERRDITLVAEARR